MTKHNLAVGDVVWAVFPFIEIPGNKERPALVVDIDEHGNATVTACQITSTNRSSVSNGHWVEADSRNGLAMGLFRDSFINMDVVVKLEISGILKKIGYCPEPLLDQILVYLGYK